MPQGIKLSIRMPQGIKLSIRWRTLLLLLLLLLLYLGLATDLLGLPLLVLREAIRHPTCTRPWQQPRGSGWAEAKRV
jgi:hypothetical protein